MSKNATKNTTLTITMFNYLKKNLDNSLFGNTFI